MTTADIPKVRIVDKDGKAIAEGYYFEMPEWQGYPIKSEGAPEKEIPIVRGVVFYDPGDWGMENKLRVVRVTPPHRIEVIEKEKAKP